MERGAFIDHTDAEKNTLKDIARNVDAIVRMVEENSTAIKQVSTETEQLGAHAENLQEAVSLFRA